MPHITWVVSGEGQGTLSKPRSVWPTPLTTLLNTINSKEISVVGNSDPQLLTKYKLLGDKVYGRNTYLINVTEYEM